MSEDLLRSLDQKIDLLIERCQKLQQENIQLKARESELVQERARLVEKNELARNRVEAMIAQLKSLDIE